MMEILADKEMIAVNYISSPGHIYDMNLLITIPLPLGMSDVYMLQTRVFTGKISWFPT